MKLTIAAGQHNWELEPNNSLSSNEILSLRDVILSKKPPVWINFPWAFERVSVKVDHIYRVGWQD